MKSIIKTVSHTLEYPKLMQSTGSNYIVLFEKYGCGTIINGKTKDGQGVGYYSEGWNMVLFKPFTGTVELSGK